jgi:hypothetical protein
MTTKEQQIVKLVQTPRGVCVMLDVGVIPLGIASLSVNHRHVSAACRDCKVVMPLHELNEGGWCEECACAGLED